jgi:hypothetical protein
MKRQQPNLLLQCSWTICTHWNIPANYSESYEEAGDLPDHNEPDTIDVIIDQQLTVIKHHTLRNSSAAN